MSVPNLFKVEFLLLRVRVVEPEHQLAFEGLLVVLIQQGGFGMADMQVTVRVNLRGKKRTSQQQLLWTGQGMCIGDIKLHPLHHGDVMDSPRRLGWEPDHHLADLCTRQLHKLPHVSLLGLGLPGEHYIIISKTITSSLVRPLHHRCIISKNITSLLIITITSFVRPSTTWYI